MKKQLTDRQEEILVFIKQFREENGYPPTLREIGKKFEISSTFGVKRHLDALVKKGYLNIESNASRGISFQRDTEESQETKLFKIEDDYGFHKVPILGRVAAGVPILAEENIEGSIVVDSSFMKKSENCFALKVKGDSMINAGIFEGDLVIVSSKRDVVNGDIVVALLEDDATVKTYELKNKMIRLLPQNPNYNPIEIIDIESFKLIGKVIGIVRWLN
ncbi:MAG: transcriptional repressor LexA [Bacteroidetes bacterium]|nr:transcriptional repressor LexA [Bacteroidota bacterium]